MILIKHEHVPLLMDLGKLVLAYVGLTGRDLRLQAVPSWDITYDVG